jgi:hypothetical protein
VSGHVGHGGYRLGRGRVGGREGTRVVTHAVKGGAGRWYYSRAHIAGNLAGSGIPANIAVTSRGFWDWA